MFVCLYVCLSVCMFAIESYMLAHIATKLGMVVEGTQGQVFNASLVPQVHVLGRDGQK